MRPVVHYKLRSLVLILIFIFIFVALFSYNKKLDTNGTNLPGKCHIYEELSKFEFNNANVTPYICSNTKLYQLQSNGRYSTCILSDKNAVVNELLSTVKENSVFTHLAAPSGSRIPMYTYSAEDMISKAIILLHDWENNLSTRLAAIAKSVSDTTFVDIGCNVGVFTLQAMKQNVPTVSVDGNIRNLLRLRLSLMANSQDVAARPLIWNFVGRNSDLKSLLLPKDCNIGGAPGKKIDLAKERPTDFYIPDTIKVMTVMGDDIAQFIKTRNVVMKVDIEGAERYFLESSETLFTQFNFLIVTVEFLEKHEYIVQFFTSRNFVPFDPQPRKSSQSVVQLNPAQWKNWPADIWWINQKYMQQVMQAL